MTWGQLVSQFLTPLFTALIAAAGGAISYYVKSIRMDVAGIKDELREIRSSQALTDKEAAVQGERIGDAVRRLDRIERKVWNGSRKDEAA